MVARRWRKKSVPLIAVTGADGSGKSVLLDALERHGAVTTTTEDLLEAALNNGQTVEALRKRFGADIVPNGSVNRLRLGDILRAEGESREWLEDELRKRLVDQIGQWHAEYEHGKRKPHAVIVESTYLYELGIEDGFDQTVAVTAEEEICRRRVKPNGSNGQVRLYLPQLKQGEKATRSTHVIRNESSLVDLQAKAAELWGQVASNNDEPVKGLRRLFAGWKRWALAGLALLAAAATVVGIGDRPDVRAPSVKEKELPMKYENYIQREARLRDLSPALIAAVIENESEFDKETEHKGAVGLMQIEPKTAIEATKRTGIQLGNLSRLSIPSVNISIGSYYLKYLLSLYDGNEVLALAAYNAGYARVDKWIEQARSSGGDIAKVSDIPLPHTQRYVSRVLSANRYYEKKFR